MTTSVSKNLKIDLTPIKVLLSIIAIYFACMTNIASASLRLPSVDPMMNVLLAADLKSCPVPHSTEYCKANEESKCEFGNLEPRVLDKNLWQNTSARPVCPNSVASKNH